MDRVLVAGATGYLGRRLVPRLLAKGHAVRALVRGGPERGRTIQELAGAEVVSGELGDPDSLASAARGMDTVVNLVGIIREQGMATFEAVHVDGTAALVQAARHAHCRRFLYVSALGAAPDASTAYARTKFRAEEIVRTSGLSYLVLRPSIVLAPDGEFYAILKDLVAIPIVPVLGPGTSRLAPVRAEDLAALEVASLDRLSAWNAVYAVCGPGTYTFNELLARTAKGLGRPIVRLHVPLVLARPFVAFLARVLPDPPITPDQLAMLERDSVCEPGPAEQAFGVRMESVEEVFTRRAS